jgi:hypothetical protein
MTTPSTSNVGFARHQSLHWHIQLTRDQWMKKMSADQLCRLQLLEPNLQAISEYKVHLRCKDAIHNAQMMLTRILRLNLNLPI